LDIPAEPTLKTIFKQKHKVKNRLTRKDSRTGLRMQPSTRQQLISYQTLDKDTAREEIQEFIRNNPRCTTSQIISKLRLNPEQVTEILDKLERDGMAYGKIVG
jgi:DNA-binding MarR family transcriptional regulator